MKNKLIFGALAILVFSALQADEKGASPYSSRAVQEKVAQRKAAREARLKQLEEKTGKLEKNAKEFKDNATRLKEKYKAEAEKPWWKW